MKRKVIIASIGAAVALGGAYVGGTWYAGRAAQDTMQKQHEWLASLPYFIVKNREYHRGWFTSTETATLQVNPDYYRFFLEREGEPLPVFELKYVQHITHGPLPLLTQFNLHPYKAVVDTEFQFSPDTQKFLSRFFGEQKPIQVENRIGFSDDGVMNIKVPSFEYEEAISGVKAKWQGLTATLDYGGDFNSIKLNALAPGLSGDAKDKGSFSFKNLSAALDHKRGTTGIMIGSSSVQLEQLNLNLSEGQPLKLQLDKLAYNGLISEKGEFIDGLARFTLDKLQLDNKPYGPAEMVATASHLHGPTLAKLSDELTRLQKQKLTRDQFTDAVVKLAKTEGMPLLTNDPRLAIQSFNVKLPDGAIRFSAEVGLKGFVAADIDKPVDLVNKLDARADFNVPRKVIETVASWQARNMFGGSDSGISNDDLDYLVGQFVEGQINRLAEQKLIRVDGDLLSADARLSQGTFTLNGNKVPLPWNQPATTDETAAEH
ncbi:YdgA family protein [Jeongeupia naejangsanensis]|uniref:YdgA family protein n=1 Tax=Jeongeupia naejangsanensis TaxID=613195 RepID=A0ABS2BQ36_9NEIS|nr:YdgA family protein [Jeongeupia naejangsanensis]MBM3117737.1 YdgA family protein [Jeongeupia naejangsanensis]